MRDLVVVLACALIAAPAAARPQKKSAPKPDVAAREREDERARRAFEALTAAEQREVADFFAAQAEQLGTFQASLMHFVLKGQDKDSGMWPEVGETPVFDPHDHAPGQPIPRHGLDADDARVQAFRALEVGPGYESAWVYDYGTRELRHTRAHKDAARLFRNGLAGVPPDLDLCTALVERALDDGSQQKVLAAFGHAYTDRDGAVYTAITLYDAWASGAQIEMPDVDTLGIVHSVLDDWKTWVAPVPATQQEALYDRIGDLYKDAHRHRGLRHALARTYLVGSAAMRDGYAPHRDGFQALWDTHRSIPTGLLPELPDPAKWEKFLSAWAKRCRSDSKLAKAGQNRRATLDRDASAVRGALLNVLTEFGAYERIEGGKSPPKR